MPVERHGHLSLREPDAPIRHVPVFNLNTHSYVALITNQGRVGISYRIMLDRTTLPQRIVSQGIAGNWRMGETGRLWPGETRRVVVDTGPGELSAREISDSIMQLCRVLD